MLYGSMRVAPLAIGVTHSSGRTRARLSGPRPVQLAQARPLQPMHDLEPHGDESYCDDNEDYPLRPWQMGDILVLLCANLSFDFTASIVLEPCYAVELERYYDCGDGKPNT
jgi:hypothetical protein